MGDYKSFAHTRWDCKYHVVFIPKYRKKVVYGELRRHLGEMLHELASHRESKIEGGIYPLLHLPHQLRKTRIGLALTSNIATIRQQTIKSGLVFGEVLRLVSNGFRDLQQMHNARLDREPKKDKQGSSLHEQN